MDFNGPFDSEGWTELQQTGQHTDKTGVKWERLEAPTPPPIKGILIAGAVMIAVYLVGFLTLLVY